MGRTHIRAAPPSGVPSIGGAVRRQPHHTHPHRECTHSAPRNGGGDAGASPLAVRRAAEENWRHGNLLRELLHREAHRRSARGQDGRDRLPRDRAIRVRGSSSTPTRASTTSTPAARASSSGRTTTTARRPSSTASSRPSSTDVIPTTPAAPLARRARCSMPNAETVTVTEATGPSVRQLPRARRRSVRRGRCGELAGHPGHGARDRVGGGEGGGIRGVRGAL